MDVELSEFAKLEEANGAAPTSNNKRAKKAVISASSPAAPDDADAHSSEPPRSSASPLHARRANSAASFITEKSSSFSIISGNSSTAPRRDLFRDAAVELRTLEEQRTRKFIEQSQMVAQWPHWRQRLHRIVVMNVWFERIIFLFIAINCITISSDNINSVQEYDVFVEVVDDVITWIYFAEMVAKMLANGVFVRRWGYFHSQWNILDCAITMVGIATFIAQQSAPSLRDTQGIAIAKALRVLRPFRMLTVLGSLRLVLRSITSAIMRLTHVLALSVVFTSMMGLVALHFFGDSLSYQCYDVQYNTLNQSSTFSLPGDANVCALSYLPSPAAAGTPPNISTLPWGMTCAAGLNTSTTTAASSSSASENCTLQPQFPFLTSTDFKRNYFNSSAFFNSQLIAVPRTSKVVSDRNDLPALRKGLVCPFGTLCLQGQSPGYGQISFNRFLAAMVLIYTVLTLDGWSEVLYAVSNALGASVAWYFLVLIIVGAVVILNLALIIITDAFSRSVAVEEELWNRQRLVEALDAAEAARDKAVPVSAEDDAQQQPLVDDVLGILAAPTPAVEALNLESDGNNKNKNTWLSLINDTRKIIFDDLLHATWFGVAMAFLAFVNVILLSSVHVGMSTAHDRAVQIMGQIIAVIFCTDGFMFGFCSPLHKTIRSPTTLFRVVIGVCAVIEWFVVGTGTVSTFFSVRLLLPLRQIPSLRHTFAFLYRAFKASFSLVALLVVIVFLFALVGVQLFSGRLCGLDMTSPLQTNTSVCDGVPRTNFDNVGYGIVTTFIIVVGDGWREIMNAAVSRSDDYAALYFCLCYLVGGYFIVNLFVALLFSFGDATGDASTTSPSPSRQPSWRTGGGGSNNAGTDSQATLGGLNDISLPLLESMDGDQINIVLTTPDSRRSSRDLSPSGSTDSPAMRAFGDRHRNYFRRVSTDVSAASFSPREEVGERRPDALESTQRRSPRNSVEILDISPEKNEKGGHGLLTTEKVRLRAVSILEPQATVAVAPGDAPADQHLSAPNTTKRTLSNVKPRAQSKVPLEDTTYLSEFRFARVEDDVDSSGSSDSSDTDDGWDDLSDITGEHRTRKHKHRKAPSAGTLTKQPSWGNLSSASSRAVAISHVAKKEVNHVLRVVEQFTATKGAIMDEELPTLTDPSGHTNILAAIRYGCGYVVTSRVFSLTILVAIVFSMTTLGLYDPLDFPDSTSRLLTRWSDFICGVVFFLEFVLLLGYLGPYTRGGDYLSKGYFNRPWKIFDFVVMVLSLLPASTVFVDSTELLTVVDVLRVSRALRPLSFIGRHSGLKIIFKSFVLALPALGNISIIVVLVWFVFSVAALQLFHGKLFACTEDTWGDRSYGPPRIRTAIECTNAGYEWTTNIANYDNIGNSLLTLFRVAATDNWHPIMFAATDTVSKTEAPLPHNRPYIVPFFVTFVVLEAFFLINFFTSIMVDTYFAVKAAMEARLRERFRGQLLSVEQADFVSMYRRALIFVKPPLHVATSTGSLRHILRRMTRSRKFEWSYLLFAALQTVLNATRFADKPPFSDKHYLYVDTAFTLLFWTLLGAKGLVLGVSLLEQNTRRLELTINLITSAGIVLELVSSPSNLSEGLRLVYLVRLYRVIYVNAEMRLLVETLVASAASFSKVAFILFLTFFLFAVIGTVLFGRVRWTVNATDGRISNQANFQRLDTAFLTLLRVATLDNWAELMLSCAIQEPSCSRQIGDCGLPVVAQIYFCIVVIVLQWMGLNFFTAALMDSFTSTEKEERYAVQRADIVQFRRRWKELVGQSTTMPLAKLQVFVARLGTPLGPQFEGEPVVSHDESGKVIFLPPVPGFQRVLHFLRQLDINMVVGTQGPMATQADVFDALMRHFYGVKLPAVTSERLKGLIERRFEVAQFERTVERVDDISGRCPDVNLQHVAAAAIIQSRWRGTRVRRIVREAVAENARRMADEGLNMQHIEQAKRERTRRERLLARPIGREVL